MKGKQKMGSGHSKESITTPVKHTRPVENVRRKVHSSALEKVARRALMVDQEMIQFEPDIYNQETHDMLGFEQVVEVTQRKQLSATCINLYIR